MIVPYDLFTNAFLSKTTEYDFASMMDFQRNGMIDGFMKRAISDFKSICLYDFTTTGDDNVREFDVEVKVEDLDELIDIISEGMLVQWMKPFAYNQENLMNALNTRDFTTYSPSGLLSAISAAYKKAQKDYVQMKREYSYIHGDLTELHL